METIDSFRLKYLPQEELDRIILKVQQARQDKEDNWRWQCYLAEINKTSALGKDKSSTSSVSNTESGSCCSTDEDKPCKLENLNRTKKHTPSQACPTSPKKNITSFDQHLKTCETIGKIQLSIQSLLAGIGVQLEAAREVHTDNDEDGPTSARAAKNRQIRLVEFNARFRRNYIYPLQIEVDRCSEQLAGQAPTDSPVPSNTSRQSALRTLERGHAHAFQALQVFQRQGQALRELFLEHRLFDDLLNQLARLAQLASALGLPHEGVDSQRRGLKEQLAQLTLNQDMSRLGLTSTRHTPHRNTHQKLGPSQYRSPAARTSHTRSRPARGTSLRPRVPPQGSQIRTQVEKIPQAAIHTWTLCEQDVTSEPVEQPASSGASSDQQQPVESSQPVNVRVYLMQHEPAPLYAAMTEVQEAGTQTTRLESRGVGTDTEQVDSARDSLGITVPHGKLADIGDEVLTPQLPVNDSLTARLQRAVLSELAGETNHLGPLIEQLLREEFL